MARDADIRRLKAGPKSWNTWRRENPNSRPDFSGAILHGLSLAGQDLRGAFLYNADLSFAQLDKVNLDGSNLAGAVLDGASVSESSLVEANLAKAHLTGTTLYADDLTHADLTEAYLDRAIMRHTTMREASLKGAVLTRASLVDVLLEGANMEQIVVGGTAFCNLDMRAIQGLQSADHLYPSTIGFDTILRSGGDIPIPFLRGAGMQEAFIQSIPTYIAQNQYYSCFICHSSKDIEFVNRLHADLQNAGVRCWYAPEDMETGGKINPTLEHQIFNLDKLLVILSDNSLQSPWVETEVEKAVDRERLHKLQVLLPIRIDAAVMGHLPEHQAWAADIRRSRNIGDFSQWQDQHTYDARFNKLLQDMRIART